MISFPNCKINLGLRILNKRADGYHNLVSVFYPVQWCDALEIIKAKEFFFECEGLKIDASPDSNLCVRAYKLLHTLYGLHPVKMILLKNIPTGAGLGGGSADGAFTLKMLNEYFKLQLSETSLKNLALQLGSDCPFFIENKPMIVMGKGEEIEAVQINLSGLYLVVIFPGIVINTAWAFSEYAKRNPRRKPGDKTKNFIEQIQQPVSAWKEVLVNDFEEIVVRYNPEIGQVKEQLYKAGAAFASMTGSGSAVYGIFKNRPMNVSIPSGARIFSTVL